jgi:hypothetical protein
MLMLPPGGGMVSETTLLGAAGEHYVMCQLLRRGFIAALAPVGVPNCDIVVTDDIGDRLCAIQVKTRRDLGSDGGWHMSQKHERLVSPTLFYTFVNFRNGPDELPTCLVVPSEIVAGTLATAHQLWLGQPGAKGQQRNDSGFRRFLPCYAKTGYAERTKGWLDPYLNAWELLTQVADQKSA